MPRWVATSLDHICPTTAVFIEADTIEEAAIKAARWLEAERDDGEDIDNVFVAQWDDRVAFSTALTAERSEMQCCGGPAPLPGGHWATCPMAEEDEATREMDAVQPVTLHVMHRNSHVAVACESVEEAKGVAESYADRGEAAPFAISIGGTITLYNHADEGWRSPTPTDLEHARVMVEGDS